GVPLARVDYIEIVDAETMRPIEAVDRPALCAVAVYIGETRLIDNIALEADIYADTLESEKNREI
ncbi:MAG: pantoate--beta-alanine ligase, partial [Clostridiales Family XIII bacterium]|nr:pantoate--beta-alanine ligase [Clostridiales Family XIII bacterium]